MYVIAGYKNQCFSFFHKNLVNTSSDRVALHSKVRCESNQEAPPPKKRTAWLGNGCVKTFHKRQNRNENSDTINIQACDFCCKPAHNPLDLQTVRVFVDAPADSFNLHFLPLLGQSKNSHTRLTSVTPTSPSSFITPPPSRPPSLSLSHE